MNPDDIASTPLSLIEQLNRELALLGLPETPWMPERRVDEQPVVDVAIIGAGMAGLTAAAALKLIGIHNIGVYDAAPAGAEGPWATHARMQTLRSPKELAGPALGIPSLTFRAWYTNLYGEAAWVALDRIPRLTWHAYLQWYRQALKLPVHNQHRLLKVTQCAAPGLTRPIARLYFASTDAGQHKTVLARHVVLATGMDGLGGPNVPEAYNGIDRRYWRHSSEAIDFTSLRDKRVAIVGGGDSALDAAATALDSGARHVDIYARNAGYTKINYWKAFTHSGHRYGYPSLLPSERADVLSFLQQQRTPPARGTLQRLQDANNLHIHFQATPQEIKIESDQLKFQAGGKIRNADFLILATGYVTDLSRRAELSELLPHIRFFEAGELDGRLPASSGVIPQLQADFAFTARHADAESLLENIHCFTGQALLSLGKVCGDIPGISVGAQQLARGIAAKLYRAEHAWHCARLREYDEQEVTSEALVALYHRTAPDAAETEHAAEAASA